MTNLPKILDIINEHVKKTQYSSSIYFLRTKSPKFTILVSTRMYYMRRIPIWSMFFMHIYRPGIITVTIPTADSVGT